MVCQQWQRASHGDYKHCNVQGEPKSKPHLFFSDDVNSNNPFA